MDTPKLAQKTARPRTKGLADSLTRRGFATLSVGAAAMAAAAGATSSPASVAPSKPAPEPSRLLPANPETSARQFMRLFCSTGGECVLTCEGIIYGRESNRVAQRLVGFRSLTIVRSIEYEPGRWRTEQREAMHYTDITTGDVLTQFRSPYSGEDLIPFGYVSPFNVYFFDSTGAYMAREDAKVVRGPEFAWYADATDVWVTESRFNAWPSGISEAEFPRMYAGAQRESVDVMTFRASARDVADASRAAVPSQMTLLSDAPWPLWMQRGKAPGGVLWQGFGRKYTSFAELPRRFVAGYPRVYPGFLEDPWKFPEFEFSTAAQIRRLRAAGKL